MFPTSKEAKRIAELFHRRESTPWHEREIRQFRKLKITDADLNLIERYYYNERKKEDEGIHRRDLYTFLNNYAGELDRAIAWNERVVKRKAKSKLHPKEPELELSDEQIEKNKAFIAKEMEKLRKLMTAPQVVRDAALMFDAKLAD